MDPFTPAAANAAIQAAERIAKATNQRHQAVGVARIGSPEDRIQAYRRLLESAGRHAMRMQADFYLRANGVKSDVMQRNFALVLEDRIEMVCALDAVRLCGTQRVVDVAQELADACNSISFDADEDQFQKQTEECVKARLKYLFTCRMDLPYNGKWWHPRNIRRKLALRRQRRDS